MHTLAVRAIDGAGNVDDTPATRTFDVEVVPASCVLQKARARVFIFRSKELARLVVKYETKRKTKVTVSYTAHLKNKKSLKLGKVSDSFKGKGLFRTVASKLTKADVIKLRTKAASFTVKFSLPGAKKECGQFYTKQLTKKRVVQKQFVWFQSDSVF
jgi:hypothetical protein